MKHSIVTKTGDDGKTFLLAGVRIAKNHIRVKTYGECDELNSLLGLCQSTVQDKEILEIMSTIQFQIFELSSILATPNEAISNEQETKNSELIQKYLEVLEEKIEKLEPLLPELKNFILPGGSLGASYLHLARTVCRRVERSILDLYEIEKINIYFLSYFNRLSDLLFILARWENHKSDAPEKIWKRS